MAFYSSAEERSRPEDLPTGRDETGARTHMAERTITVRGFGVASVKPDGARLRLVVRSVAETPDAALTDATERSRVLEDVLRELAIDPSAWTTDLVAVREERRWDERQQREVGTGFSATAGLLVLLEDLSQAGALMREAVSRAEAQVGGPWWHVAPSNEAGEVACRLAVEDAARKARALASAVGAAVGEVRSVSEPKPLSSRYEPAEGFVALARSEPEDMSLQTGGLEIGISVDVTFDLEIH
jgi:uncharacterized protein YggE